MDETADTTHMVGYWSPAFQVLEQERPSVPSPPRWSYDGADPALMLFTAAVARFNLSFPSGGAVLELGCAESDWLERMQQMDPTLHLVGVDARAQQRAFVMEGSAMDASLFPADTFDRVVLLGALEHFGLGFYGDPVDESGDVKTMQNVARWLRPGGFVYFDVPCQPTFRVAPNRHFRSYAPADITSRLLDPAGLQEVNRGYSLPEPWAGQWCHKPMVERVPYWFVAVVAQKPV